MVKINKAVNLMHTVGWSLHAHRLPMFMCAGILYVFGLTHLAAAIASLAACCWLISYFTLRMAEAFRDKQAEIWKSKLSGTAWQTACHEKISIIRAFPDGRHFVVQYPDGEQAVYPGCLLHPADSHNTCALDALPDADPSPAEAVMERMLKSYWRTPNGEIGIVRAFEFLSPSDERTKVNLKLASGRRTILSEFQLEVANEQQ